MSKAERLELARVVRMRVKVSRAAVERQKAEMRAEVERQLSAIQKFEDEAWAELREQLESDAALLNRKIGEVCSARGFPESFHPSCHLTWYDRGENASAERRSELRKLAYARIEVAGKAAVEAIEARASEVVTELAVDGLGSGAAHAFLESMPTPAELMPPVSVAALDGADRMAPAAAMNGNGVARKLGTARTLDDE
jgi:hypothetical protein